MPSSPLFTSPSERGEGAVSGRAPPILSTVSRQPVSWAVAPAAGVAMVTAVGTGASGWPRKQLYFLTGPESPPRES